MRRASSKPIVVCGAAGSLGRAITQECEKRVVPILALDHANLDICDPAAVEQLCKGIRPVAIINAAGYVRVDEAESDPDGCFRLNVTGARILAAAADLHGIPSVTYSTDLVFDGATLTPYVESSEVRPMNVYGQSKVAAEMAAADFSRSLCIRTAAFFGAGPRSDFLTDALRAIRAGRTTPAIDDVIMSPTYLPDLAVATLELLLSGWTGIVHLTNQDPLSWADFARRGAEALQLDAALVDGRPLRAFGLAARRPAFSALTSERVQIMPRLSDALDRYAANPTGLRKQDQ